MIGRKNFLTGLIGFALIAAPITATAMNTDSSRNDSRQPQAQSQQAPEPHASRAPFRSNSPTRKEEPAKMTRKEAPATAIRTDAREQHTASRAPAVATHRDSREATRSDHVASYDHHDGSYDHRNYDEHGHVSGAYVAATPVYVMPQGYEGGACAWARHLHNVYYQDQNTGHPAAASDLLSELRRAERDCGGPYSYNAY
jgi:hypothetical protein